MVDDGFYKSLAVLGQNAGNKFKELENALIFILGQIVLFEIDKKIFL